MIPVKLKMRNFMCYREPPSLYFDGIHTACICGSNGNGKSALIDAITWALWGQTRAKSDDDLVHATQSEMEVEFDFAVKQQGYRVIRKHAKPKRRPGSGQSSLDLFIASGRDFKPISGDRIRETEQKIRELLHMDYDTFINSAFLRQGRADEFTRQPPTKRKEVLANILGLALYEELEAQAKEQAKKREAEKSQLENAINDMNSELAQKPDCQAQLEQVRGELASRERAIEEHQARLDRLRRERESLEKKEAQLAQLTEHITRTGEELKRWEEQISQHRLRLREYEELIAQRSRVETGYAELAQVRRLNNELEQKLRQSVTLNEYRHKLEMAIERAQSSLITEHRLAQSRIEELDTKCQRIPLLEGELQEGQARWQQLANEEETLQHQKQSYQELQSRLNYLESTTAGLAEEVEAIQGKLKLLLTQSDAKCPLCERELGAEGRRLIEQKYTGDRESKSATIQSHQAELKARKIELRSLESEIARRETRLSQERAMAQSNISLREKELGEAKQADIQLTEERQRLAGVEERLARKDFATSEQQALTEVAGELAKLSYSSLEHEQVRRRLAELEPYEEAGRKLNEADRLIIQESELILRAEQASAELRLGLAADEGKRQTLSREVSLMPQVLSNLSEVEKEHQVLLQQQKQLAELMGVVKGKLQRCEELEEKKKVKEDLRRQAIIEEQIYKELAQAFGKEGIQAMIIERSLPEIEIEANKLLGRMTDNRMHVKIEAQRQTKKGQVVETLDINISDELGLRSYEMFSGGEAFRINFAIRIALSKLLARRAGAPLPTLIIDEGFGTQDSSGIEKLKEAINSIQDDFDKILVITHIEELKDTFPTRIDVIKTADGSTLEVS